MRATDILRAGYGSLSFNAPVIDGQFLTGMCNYRFFIIQRVVFIDRETIGNLILTNKLTSNPNCFSFFLSYLLLQTKWFHSHMKMTLVSFAILYITL